jgi:hypothetical protein
MSKRMSSKGSICFMAGLLLFLGGGCATVMTASPVDVKVPTPAIAQKMPLKAAVLISDPEENYAFVGTPQTPGIAKGEMEKGWNLTLNLPLGQMEKKGILDGFSQAFEKVVLVKSNDYPTDTDLIVIPKHVHFQYWYKIIPKSSWVFIPPQWEANARISMKFRVVDKKGMLLWEKEVVSPDTGGVLLNPMKRDEIPPATASAAAGSIGAAVREALNAMASAREIHAYISEKNKPEGSSPGIAAGSGSISQGGTEKVLSVSPGRELSRLAVWDLLAREVKATYAQELTSILVSEISKLGRYEVYSQENVRTLAGWTAERMTLGCTDTKCLTALGQMDVGKLISGSVGKIGSRYSVSLNLFDTQNAKAEKAVSEFGRSEDELIDLVQVAVRKLLGGTGPTVRPSPPKPLAGSPTW